MLVLYNCNFSCSESEGMARIQRSYATIRRLQLFIGSFNVVNCHFIFTTKLATIGAGIISGYAAIAHFNEYPIFGVMYYVIFANVSLVYMLIYEKGFKISDTFQRAKNLLRLSTARHKRSLERKILEKQFVSIPSVGIKVGAFHMLERTSTPVFLHYVLTNIVNMLVVCG